MENFVLNHLIIITLIEVFICLSSDHLNKIHLTLSFSKCSYFDDQNNLKIVDHDDKSNS
jgi:hypothetical protein